MGAITASLGGLTLLAALSGDAFRSVVVTLMSAPALSGVSAVAEDVPLGVLGVGLAAEALAMVAPRLGRARGRRAAPSGSAVEHAATPATPMPAMAAAVDEAVVDEQASGAPEALDALMEAVGQLLVGLRRDFGVRYGSRTWIEEVLPRFGGPGTDAALARDLLAVAALDAAGICADVTALTATHAHGELTATAASLHSALSRLAGDLRSGTAPRDLPAFERSTWAS